MLYLLSHFKSNLVSLSALFIITVLDNSRYYKFPIIEQQHIQCWASLQRCTQYMCDLQTVNVWPVGDVFYVTDGIIYPPFFSTQDDPVEVSVHHSGAKTFKLWNQPDSRMTERNTDERINKIGRLKDDNQKLQQWLDWWKVPGEDYDLCVYVHRNCLTNKWKIF